ncbi:bacterio-opsin activator HTH domain-containing protein [Natrinema pellirubrum DSM 15624]|uniref:Bacterio-opsin activator HTH domain-containing protein n=1 Tax=Natrinema pellirubrum (strain DSM 15624 / CIP 106293 / JCM 10476 / NCIMB 786 / 157) TaxID=797303 RepID=L9Z3Z0_NATP1|nr:bacterio-opsin activator HTH domain-containing protein [Natrinema pellirubrum DSM 15624]
MIEEGGVLQEASVTHEGWFFRVAFPSDEALERFHGFFLERGFEVDVRKLRDTRESAGGGDAGSQFGLTSRQREALVAAVEAGYLDIPRSCTLAELGERLGISQNAASERFRRGVETLVENTVYDDRSPLSGSGWRDPGRKPSRPRSLLGRDAGDGDRIRGVGHEPRGHDAGEDDHPGQFDERLGDDDRRCQFVPRRKGKRQRQNDQRVPGNGGEDERTARAGVQPEQPGREPAEQRHDDQEGDVNGHDGRDLVDRVPYPRELRGDHDQQGRAHHRDRQPAHRRLPAAGGRRADRPDLGEPRQRQRRGDQQEKRLEEGAGLDDGRDPLAHEQPEVRGQKQQL